MIRVWATGKQVRMDFVIIILIILYLVLWYPYLVLCVRFYQPYRGLMAEFEAIRALYSHRSKF